MLTPLAALALLQAAPALKFSPGEVLKYQMTLSGTQMSVAKGATNALSLSGSHTVIFKVASVANGTASMAVSYSGARASATATSLAPELKKDKAKIEKLTAERLKRSMTGEKRRQTVTPLGKTTYIYSGDGKTMTISDGAFLMLILPSKLPALNGTWKAGVRMPDPNATGMLKMTYKYLGMTSYGSEQAYKISFSSNVTDSGRQGKVTGRLSIVLQGTLMLGAKSGKVLRGDIRRTLRRDVTAEQGTISQTEDFTQTFTKA